MYVEIKPDTKIKHGTDLEDEKNQAISRWLSLVKIRAANGTSWEERRCFLLIRSRIVLNPRGVMERNLDNEHGLVTAEAGDGSYA